MEGNDESEEEKKALPSAVSSLHAFFRRYGTIVFAWIKYATEREEIKVLNNIFQFSASLAFVSLYVIGTYSQPVKGSFRSILELFLCFVFAGEFLHRFFVNHKDAGSKFRMLTTPINLLDLLSFAPTLFEVLLQQISPGFTLGRFDLRWTKLLRSLRVIRIGLLAAELRSLNLSTKRGGWLAAGTNFRLIQLAASPILLLFGASAIIQIVEHIPFHKAVYFVATTLSTVGGIFLVLFNTARMYTEDEYSCVYAGWIWGCCCSVLCWQDMRCNYDCHRLGSYSCTSSFVL